MQRKLRADLGADSLNIFQKMELYNPDKDLASHERRVVTRFAEGTDSSGYEPLGPGNYNRRQDEHRRPSHDAHKTLWLPRWVCGKRDVSL